MSKQFRSPPRAFVKHNDVKLFGVNTKGVDHSAPKRNNGPQAPLRDSHLVLLAVDGLVALQASFKKWRNRRQTLRALADLDEHQLRDIGLTRDETFLGHQTNYRALAELNEV